MFSVSQVWSKVSGLTRYGRPAKASMPMRSLGRASMKRWVISLMASTRFARLPPRVKSSVSMERETSSAIMMSIPLAWIWVIELLNCGRASARMPVVSAAASSAPENAPARAVRGLPRCAMAAVKEYTTEGAPPARPRRRASSAGNTSRHRNHG